MDDLQRGLDTLLDLDGIEQRVIGGYWVKFSAKLIEATLHRPHGIRYSLTLHNAYGTRLVGFDNAHLADIKRKKYSAKRVVWDHKHNRSVVSDYDFESAVSCWRISGIWLTKS